MKTYLMAIMVALTMCAFTIDFSYAQEGPTPTPIVIVEPTPVVPTTSDTDTVIDAAAQVLKNTAATITKEGATTVTIVFAVILGLAQLLIQLTKTSVFGKIFHGATNATKLLIVAVCTVITTAVPMLLSGVGWLATITSGAVLAAIMVAGNQIFKASQEPNIKPTL